MADQPPAPARIAVGKITKPHGVRGEVAVLVLSQTSDRFAPGRELLLQDGRGLTVASARSHHGRLLATFEGVSGRDQADQLRGSYLFVARGDLPALEEGSWWPHELEGCEVFTDGGRSLGTLEEVLHTEANDVWIARDGRREILIPALRDVVVSVDLEARRITVREIEGLTTPGEE